MLRGMLFSDETFWLKKIKIRGNKAVSSRKIKKILSQKPIKFFSLAKNRETFSEDILEVDIKNIKDFYKTEGFLNVEISPELIKDAKKHFIRLTLNIKENYHVKTGKISYDFIGDNLSEKISKIENFPVSENERFRDENILSARKEIIKILKNNGYPLNKTDFNVTLNKDKTKADIEFKIDAGKFFKFGKIRISGNRRTAEKYLIREKPFHFGEMYGKDKLSIAQRRIMNTDVFKFVTVKADFKKAEKNIVPLDIVVEELPKYNLKFGIGYGAKENFRISADIRRIGNFRDLDKLDLFIKYSSLLPYHLKLRLTEPLVISSRNKIISDIYLKKEIAEAYKIRRYGGSLSFYRDITDSLTGFVGYSYEKNLLDLDESLLTEYKIGKMDKYNKSQIMWGLIFNNSSPAFYPYGGFVASGVFTFAGAGFSNDFNYIQGLFELKKYVRLYKETVIAVKSKIGIMKPVFGDDVTPVAERFYAGGSNSVRGWSYSELGPENSAGKPTGGNSYAENSLELRFPIWKIIYGGLFTDCGNVWSKSLYYNYRDLKYAYGFGIRAASPIGHIRLDNALSEDKDYQIFLSIGQAF